MTPGDRERLGHMLRYARKAVDQLDQRTAEELEADEDRLLVLVACLVVVGEAGGQVSVETRNALPQIDWQAAKSMRNVLVHRYFEIDAGIIAATVTDDLPRLISALETLLEGGSEA